jgi:hypothetical protein
MVSVEERVNQLLAEYESYDCEGWDGLGSEPITTDTLAAARKLLLAVASGNMPYVAPGADGSIGMEWLDIILDVGPDKELNGLVELSGRVRLK